MASWGTVRQSDRTKYGKTRPQNTEVRETGIDFGRKKNAGKYSSLTPGRYAEKDPEIFRSHECAAYR
jgi:hypothetical protein